MGEPPMTCPYFKEHYLGGILPRCACSAYESGKLRTPSLYEESVYCRSDAHGACPTYRHRVIPRSNPLDEPTEPVVLLG